MNGGTAKNSDLQIIYSKRMGHGKGGALADFVKDAFTWLDRL